jgi:hypothetical protein
MKIYEYRIVIPTTIEKYRIANIYMIAAASREESGQTQGEGVEIRQNEPFQNETESGQYTYKVMHFKSRVPSFVRIVLPDKYLHLHERSWNAYPHYLTKYNLPGMGDAFVMSVETQHVPYRPTDPFPDNAVGLSPEHLKKRKILWLDVVDSKPAPDAKENCRGFACPEGGIVAPLVGDKKGKAADESKPPVWAKTYPGDMMCCVKVVTFKFKWRGLQSMTEKYVMNTIYHNIFLGGHRKLTKWAGQWFPMSIEDVRAFEARMLEECNRIEFDKEEVPPDVVIPEVAAAGDDDDEAAPPPEEDEDFNGDGTD